MIKEILNNTYKGDINNIFMCGYFLGMITMCLYGVVVSLTNFLMEKALLIRDKRKKGE